MMTKKTHIPMYLGLALAVGAPGAYAIDWLAEPYVGFGYGQYKFEFETADRDTDFDESKEALKIYGGTQITKSLAAEVTLYEFDSAEDTSLQSDLEGVSVAALFNAPLYDDRFSLFAKAGWFWFEAEVESTVSGGPILSQDFEGDDLFFGLGAKFGLTDTVDIRIEYDRFTLDDTIDPELDYASASIQFNF